MDEVLRKSVQGKKSLSHSLSDIQEKIKDVDKAGQKVGLRINEAEKQEL
jgi:hypothetical protein